MTKGKEDNATFALHGDIMRHCGEILGISIAERTGGADGYNLLLGYVKSSLPFAFLNGATSYASFCVDLHMYCTSCALYICTVHQDFFTRIYLQLLSFEMRNIYIFFYIHLVFANCLFLKRS
jgi:hypothetical protein